MKIQSINPATEDINREFDLFSPKSVLDICKKAKNAFQHWKKVPITKRCEHLHKLAQVLRNKKTEYAKLMTLEMGKPIEQSEKEIEKCAWTADYFAEHAEKWLQDEIIKTEAPQSLVAHEPLGVILSIMPWNFPFWQVIRFAVPALAVGNVSILKHANTVPICAFALEEAFKLADFPENVFTTILTDHNFIKKLFKGCWIQGVSLTGSVAAGKQVGKLAGENIKKFVLELGGSDPFIVLEDADIKLAAQGATQGRVVNSGQSCIAAKRFIVVESVANEFISEFVAQMKKLIVGDPFDRATQVGPMANQLQVETLEQQVKKSVALGAKVNVGGKRMLRQGYFFEPTVLTEVKKNMPVFKEEVFGPVAPVFVVKNTEQAIQLANESNLGLGASLWTKNLEKGNQLARDIEAGLVFVNRIVASDPRLPFGGIKESGIGRELSRYGLLEFANIKTIVIS